jgi:UDP-N-acetylmuramoylalanine--D-glutamate ligase
MSSLAGTRVVVVGLGRSGVAAARLCRRYGADVVAVDHAAPEKLSAAALGLRELGVEVVAGDLAGFDFRRASFVVISPGVPNFSQLSAAEAAGLPVIGEVELAWRYLPDVPVLAITGSNGKSTTVTLVGELLTAIGKRPFVGGNLGEPPCEIVPQPDRYGHLSAFDHDSLVLEISSFQAERIPTFHPRAAALLNVSPNHLDRYEGFDQYVAAKGNIFVNQKAADVAVAPVDDERCVTQARRGDGELIRFGEKSHVTARYVYDALEIVDRTTGDRFARKDIRLPGDHNALNVCAALALCSRFQPSADIVRELLARFEGLAHRIVRIATVAGITYYDDSKGTNVGATVAAVRGLPEARVVLIAGGRDKLGSYEPLAAALRDRGRAAVLIGEAAARLAEAIGDAVPVVHATSMEEAVAASAKLAVAGDAVLLSPACSSFDMFRDYKHRGEAFVAAVKAL